MINLNYLGHSFIYNDIDNANCDDGFLYDCQNCGISIIFWNDRFDSSDLYFIEYSHSPVTTELNLSCDEWKIKSIIE